MEGCHPPFRTGTLRLMATQIILAWSITQISSSFGGAQAAAAMAAVPLYESVSADPVLGQLLGLTVASDNTVDSGSGVVTRTLTLNMATPQAAPPAFPCHPVSSTPPELPFLLRSVVTLPGSFFVQQGSSSVATTKTQLPSIPPNAFIQFLSQQGVFYQVLAVGPTSILLSSAYSGVTANTNAFKEVPAPVTKAAIYSTSPLDTNGVATSPTIPAGPGARTVILSYKDSTGAGPFTVTVNLTGKRPAAVTLAGGSIDIAEIDALNVASVGSFGNSVGQITLASLSASIPVIPANRTPVDFLALTDEAQLLLAQPIAYLPPSYFALAQQGASAPQLAGEFAVTTGSKDAPSTADQTGALTPGNSIEFASQPGTFYVVAAVTPNIVTLAVPYSGIDDNFTGSHNVNSNIETKGNLGDKVIMKRTGARNTAAVSTPTSAQLSAVLAQFVAPETAGPPPNPPLDPATVPIPSFLSGLFTRTLQLALATPVTAKPIGFA